MHSSLPKTQNRNRVTASFIENCTAFVSFLQFHTMTQFQYDNHTIFAIKNNGEKAALVMFETFILLSSLLGDSAILVASLRYKAFNQHKMIETVIQHLAACDLLFSTSSVFPSLASILADKWVFGEVLCHFRANSGYMLSVTAWYFISLLVTSKLLVLRFPLRAATVSTKRCHQICAGSWFVGLVFPLIYLFVALDDVVFDYRMYICIYGFSNDIWKWLKPLLTALLSTPPNLVILIMTTMLILEARKVVGRGRESLRLQGIMIVIMTAVVYYISAIPYTVYIIAAPHVMEDQPGAFHVWYFRFAACCVHLNTVSNFFIYSLTLTPFRKFLYGRYRALAGRVSTSSNS